MSDVMQKESNMQFGDKSTGAPVGQDPKNPKRDEKVSRLGTASIPRLITEFAIPAILGTLVNGAYGIIDSVFLGQAIHEIGASVLTAANPIMTIFLAIGMLIGTGGNALAALRLGEGKRIDAEKCLGNVFTVSIIAAIIVVILAMNDSFMHMLISIAAPNTTPEVQEYSRTFIRIVSCGFVFQCVGFGMNNFIRTAGAPNRALLTMIIGAVACTFFNALFVLILGWGVEGSAFATVCGQGVSCISVLWYFIFTKNTPLKLHFRYMRPYPRIIGRFLILGLASFAVQAGAAIVSLVTNSLLGIYGATSSLGVDDAFASIGVIQRIAVFTVLPLVGVSIALQPILGFNYGAKLIGRVKKTLIYGMLGATVIAICMWLLLIIFADPIVNAFGIEHENLKVFTINALKIQMALLPFIGFQIVGSNYFQATGQPIKSVILSLSRQILFLIPMLILLPMYMPAWFGLEGLDALYYAAPVSDFLAIFTTAIFIIWEMKKLKKLENDQKPVPANA